MRPLFTALAPLSALCLALCLALPGAPARAQPAEPTPEPIPPAKPKAPAPEAPADKGAAAPDAEVQRVLDGLQAFYADARDLKAQFTQTYTYKVYGRTQVSKGRVLFKKPRMMRWDYKTPVQKVFVADGATLWVYEPEENQAFRRDLASSQLPVALTFMSGEGKLADEFDVRLLQGPAEVYNVELIPKRHAGDYKSLLLKVDRQTFAVQSSTVIDPVGNTNQVVFSSVETNSGVADGAFKFSPPKGVRIITEPGR